MVETGREVGRREQNRIGFVEGQRFKFGVKRLWRDSSASVRVDKQDL